MPGTGGLLKQHDTGWKFMPKNNTDIIKPSSFERRLLATLAIFCLAFHGWLAWLGTLQGESAWAFALIEGSNLLGIDDAYRYFLSHYAFKEVAIYAWDYVLPAATVFFGLISTLVNDNILAGRLVMLIVSLAGYAALYRSTRLAGANLWPALISLLLLAFMPVQSIMSISYYGEALLVVVTAIAMLAYLRSHLLLCSLLASLLPLIRPEGIFILAPFSVYFLARKRYWPLLFSGLAGFLFFLFISYQAGNFRLSLLLDWRLELRTIWKTFIMPNTYNNFGMFSTYNLLWIVLAHAGFLSPRLRQHWPLWSGSILWSLFYTGMVITGMSSYESRYFAACFPAFVIGFAFFLQHMLHQYEQNKHHYKKALALAVTLFIFLEHFLQYDPIKSRFGGQRWPLNQVPVIHPNFIHYTPEKMSSLAAMADGIMTQVHHHKEIDTLMVREWPVLYFLDKHIIGSGIQLQFSPIPQEVTDPSTGGSFFTYSQYGQKFRYYNIADIHSPYIDGVAIYVGPLTTPYLNPIYHFPPYQMTVIGYQSYQTPNWRYEGEIHIR